MSTISKERLEQLASGNAWVCVQDDEAAELARIALASLEAEAVCYLTWHQGFRAPDDCEEYVVEANPGDKSCDGSPAFPVYAAPPAPVSVNITRDQIRDIFMRNGFTIKDGQTDLKDYVYAAADELVSLLKTQAPVSVPDAMEMDDDFDSAFEHGKAVGWNAYRAAMLQGADRPQNEPQNIPENIPATQFKPVADLYGLTSPTGGETSFTFDAVEARDFIDGGWSCQEYVELERFQEAVSGNSPMIQDGWVACVERMPSAGEQVLAYRPDAPESNDPLIKMATYVGRSAHGHGFDCYCKPTHWMPLPAAPQQEA
ncbi:DUF551 domain-containing protein [Enterobacter sp.]|uniref:DUF551 domain-containing protein n=1 Tax=Enterobacter sp. TaxID=42895 RepID=UPI0029020FB6|nr:DUF551 domain-containing protein [Enterobacter sp.]MDU2080079.1 DUF551 domain-containing protein [Enterobacter sp.]